MYFVVVYVHTTCSIIQKKKIFSLFIRLVRGVGGRVVVVVLLVASATQNVVALYHHCWDEAGFSTLHVYEKAYQLLPPFGNEWCTLTSYFHLIYYFELETLCIARFLFSEYIARHLLMTSNVVAEIQKKENAPCTIFFRTE